MGGYVTFPTQHSFESHCSEMQLTDLCPPPFLMSCALLLEDRKTAYK